MRVTECSVPDTMALASQHRGPTLRRAAQQVDSASPRDHAIAMPQPHRDRTAARHAWVVTSTSGNASSWALVITPTARKTVSCRSAMRWSTMRLRA
jgi:hypothetical protein